jgi:hypothetical protein
LNKNLTIIGLIALVVILIILLLQSKCSHRDAVKVWQATTDTLRTQKNKLGQELATTTELVGSRKQIIQALNYQNDSLSIALRKAIRKRGTNTTTVINTVTEVEKETPVYITHTDILRVDSFIYVYPTYQTQFRDMWIRYTIMADRDTVRANILLENILTISHKKTRKGYTVNVLNENPYTVTSGLKSYTIKQKKKRFGISVYAGYGMGLTDFRPQPSVGVALTYSVIRF